ncbi:MAG: hypothetical protein K9L88_14630 [Chromatiaceae bacterium]|nr:hypothetical protein [Chromatiaceae bacterium]
MSPDHGLRSSARRRLILAAAGRASGALSALASARMATPQQMRGPFYPERMPLVPRRPSQDGSGHLAAQFDSAMA